MDCRPYPFLPQSVMTSVSVVIPCYKYGHFLEEAVASVLDDQAGVDVRVLIIDDASPDDSAEMARKIAARDPRVEVNRPPSTKGTSRPTTRVCSSGLTATIAFSCRQMIGSRPEPCGVPGTCLMPTPASDSSMELHCGSGTASQFRRLVRECEAGRCGLASGGSSGGCVRRRTASRRQRSSCAQSCKGRLADTTLGCPIPEIRRCG